LSCKAYDLESAMDSFSPAVGPRTVILPLLNGLKHLDTLESRFGAAAVLGGECVISAALDDEGRILHLNRMHGLTFGERAGGSSDRVRTIEAQFNGVLFDAHVSENILQSMWEKWTFIAAAAGITCLMRAAVGDILEVGGAECSVRIYEECAQIASEAGYPPSQQRRDMSLLALTAVASPLTASMLRDIESGGRTEVDQILGDLLSRRRTGAAPGASAPTFNNPSLNNPSLLTLAHLHVKAYEARRKRELGGR